MADFDLAVIGGGIVGLSTAMQMTERFPGVSVAVLEKEPALALKLEADSAERLKKLGVKVVEGVDKSGFIKAAQPIQDQLAKELGPHAVKILELVRNVK